MRKRNIIATSIVASLVAFSVTAQIAQPSGNSGKVAPISPPKATVPDNPGMLGTFFCVIVIAAAAIGANMIPSRRGHQD